MKVLDGWNYQQKLDRKEHRVAKREATACIQQESFLFSYTIIHDRGLIVNHWEWALKLHELLSRLNFLWPSWSKQDTGRSWAIIGYRTSVAEHTESVPKVWPKLSHYVTMSYTFLSPYIDNTGTFRYWYLTNWSLEVLDWHSMAGWNYLFKTNILGLALLKANFNWTPAWCSNWSQIYWGNLLQTVLHLC